MELTRFRFRPNGGKQARVTLALAISQAPNPGSFKESFKGTLSRLIKSENNKQNIPYEESCEKKPRLKGQHLQLRGAGGFGLRISASEIPSQGSVSKGGDGNPQVPDSNLKSFVSVDYGHCSEDLCQGRESPRTCRAFRRHQGLHITVSFLCQGYERFKEGSTGSLYSGFLLPLSQLKAPAPEPCQGFMHLYAVSQPLHLQLKTRFKWQRVRIAVHL